MSYHPPVPTPVTAATHVLLAANRLEARPRSPEFNRALRAEVRDPAWLLARQWQLHEFRAEDRGTPASVAVRLRPQPLGSLALPGQPTARPYNPATQPLEAAVEAQPRPIGPGLRLQLGQDWLRQLRTLPGFAGLGASAQATVLGLWAQVPRLALPAPTAAGSPVAWAEQGTLAEASQLLALAGPTAFDGYALYQLLLAAPGAALAAARADSARLEAALLGSTTVAPLPLLAPLANSPLFPNQTDPLSRLVAAGLPAADLEQAARQFVLATHRLYLLGAESTSWSTESMAYSFGVGVAGGSGLGTAHYPGGAALPWYALDTQTPPAPPTPAPAEAPLLERRVLPTEVQFPGAPAARWWEFEDRRVDFGQLTADPSDWGRMLLQEFMFLYQNDWFSIPLSVPVGTVSAIEQVLVTDVFGRSYRVQPAGAGQLKEDDAVTYIDNDYNHWRLFGQADPAATPGPAAVPRLYVPATALGTLRGRPSEQVSFRREEATNLVWAVESIVPDGFAGGLDGAAAAAQLTQALARLAPAPTPDPTATEAPAFNYQLASAVPENWLPFVPLAADARGPLALEQGALARQVPGFTATVVAPRTALLQLHAGVPYRLFEHELPPAGVRVEGLSYRARWYGGRTLNWFGRRRGVALVSGSSGLAFDQLQQ